nr:MAG TPA: hypothetical protein [Caudoviricetes sp.]
MKVNNVGNNINLYFIVYFVSFNNFIFYLSFRRFLKSLNKL